MTNIPIEETPNYQEIADEIIGLLRAAIQKIPGYAPAPAGRRRRISVVAALPDDVFNTVALVCDTQPSLAETSAMTSGRIRTSIRYSDAFRNVVKELDVIRAGTLDTINEERAEVAQGVRRVYKVAKSISSPEERAMMVPHIEAMKLAFKRAKRPASTASATPSPEPGSPDATTPVHTAAKR